MRLRSTMLACVIEAGFGAADSITTLIAGARVLLRVLEAVRRREEVREELRPREA